MLTERTRRGCPSSLILWLPRGRTPMTPSRVYPTWHPHSPSKYYISFTVIERSYPCPRLVRHVPLSSRITVTSPYPRSPPWSPQAPCSCTTRPTPRCTTSRTCSVSPPPRARYLVVRTPRVSGAQSGAHRRSGSPTRGSRPRRGPGTGRAPTR